MKILGHALRAILGRAGYEPKIGRESASQELPPDFDARSQEICRIVRCFTMTSHERIYALCQAIRYVVKHNICGDIVECGVWKGGSMMAAAFTLQDAGCNDKNLYLFDTFDGMTAPGRDDIDLNGQRATELFSRLSAGDGWASSPIEEVQRNLRSTGYPPNRVFFIKGRVEDTIPGEAPAGIALLRLDTDWYESTRHELLHLYPRLSPGGVLIIDDYGHWEGARKAVDAYVEEHNLKVLLNRIDYTGRICIKN